MSVEEVRGEPKGTFTLLNKAFHDLIVVRIFPMAATRLC